MYCPNCSTKLPDSSCFCPSCGYHMTGQQDAAPATDTSSPQEVKDVIDLTGQVNHSTPTAQKHKGTTITAILSFVAWIFLLIISLSINASYDMPYYYGASNDEVISPMLLTTIPLGLIGLFIVLNQKKKFDHLDPVLDKKSLVVYYIICTLIPSLIICISYSSSVTGSVGELISAIGVFILLPLSTFYLIFTLILANQNNSKDMCNIITAYCVGFMLSGLLGYIFIKALALVVVGIIACIVAVIMFFSSGGYIFVERRK